MCVVFSVFLKCTFYAVQFEEKVMILNTVIIFNLNQNSSRYDDVKIEIHYGSLIESSRVESSRTNQFALGVS